VQNLKDEKKNFTQQITLDTLGCGAMQPCKISLHIRATCSLHLLLRTPRLLLLLQKATATVKWSTCITCSFW